MKEISELFSELYKVLEQQGRYMEAMVNAGEEQADCLRNHDTQRLEEVVERQEKFSSEMEALEEERVRLQRELETQLGLEKDTPLRVMLPYAEEEFRKLLAGMRTFIRHKSVQLQEINELNNAMNRQALQFTNFMIRLFQPQDDNYDRDGRKKQGPGAKSRINRTI